MSIIQLTKFNGKRIFNNRKFEFMFTLSNVGNRQQKTFWSTEGFDKRCPPDAHQDSDHSEEEEEEEEEEEATDTAGATEETPFYLYTQQGCPGTRRKCGRYSRFRLF